MKKNNKNMQSTNKMNNNAKGKSQNQSVGSKSKACNNITNSNKSIGFEDEEETKSFELDDDDSHSFELK